MPECVTVGILIGLASGQQGWGSRVFDGSVSFWPISFQTRSRKRYLQPTHCKAGAKFPLAGWHPLSDTPRPRVSSITGMAVPAKNQWGCSHLSYLVDEITPSDTKATSHQLECRTSSQQALALVCRPPPSLLVGYEFPIDEKKTPSKTGKNGRTRNIPSQGLRTITSEVLSVSKWKQQLDL